MKIRIAVILFLFAMIVCIDLFFKTGSWWFNVKIVLVWGAILYDAFADFRSGLYYKLGLIAGILIILGIIQSIMISILQL